MNHKSSAMRVVIKRGGTAALLFSLGLAGAYAQPGPINMPVSGSSVVSTVSLQGMPASEYQLAGNGTLGQFTVRVVNNSAASPQSSVSCSGPSKVFFPVMTGAALARFQDGDLLTLNLTTGGDCIDFAAGAATCTRSFQATGGTGRFKNVSGGNITLTMIVVPILADGPTNPVFFAVTGDITGALARTTAGPGSQDQ